MFMKSFKCLIAPIVIVSAFSSSINTAAAENNFTRKYYQYIPAQNIDTSKLEYNEPFDTTDFYKALYDIRNLISEQGNESEIKSLLNNAYYEYLKSCDKYFAAMIKCDKNFNKENNKAVLDEFNKNSDMFESFTILLRDIFNSDYINIFSEIFEGSLTIEELDDIIKSIPNAETVKLKKTENELVTQYNNSYGDAEKAAEIYLKLLKIRKQIANSEGYNSYSDYANKNIYGREYTNKEIAEFQDAVEKYISPYFTKIVTAYYLSNTAVPDANMIEVRDKVGAVIKKINPELSWAYDYMVLNNLCSFEYSTDKNPSVSGYTVTFPYINTPYVMINPYTDYGEEYIDNAATIIHEFGHFASALHDPVNKEKYSSLFAQQVIDTCEISSQGLEILSEKYFGELFGKGASAARYSEILMRTVAILDGCIYNEWETKVFELENPTIDDLNSLAANIMSKYYKTEVDEQSAFETWTSVAHLFQSPMYYISYALSSAAACELYAMSIDNYDYAVDRYMVLSAMGQTIPFTEAIAGCGMDSVFNTDVVKKIADVIGRQYALCYNDVSDEAWYYPYILYTSHIFVPTYNTLFEPEVNITRKDFIELLGKSEDYYSGIENKYTLTFDDVDKNSDEAKYISWAYNTGIINGVSNTEFDGDSLITREQLVSVMYRYAQYKNTNVSFNTDAILSFNDRDQISDWAAEPMNWAVEYGIINGKNDSFLDPKGNATRAESAKIMTMFIKNN